MHAMSCENSQSSDSILVGSGPLQWLEEPAVAVNDHFGSEELRAIQLKVRAKSIPIR